MTRSLHLSVLALGMTAVPAGLTRADETDAKAIRRQGHQGAGRRGEAHQGRDVLLEVEGHDHLQRQ